MFIYRQKYINNLPVSIPVEIDSDRIVFEVSVPNARPNWNRSGTLTRTILLPGIGFTFEEPKTLAIGKNLLDFENLGNYKLSFAPYNWITDFTISIWKLREIQPDQSTSDTELDYLLGII